MYAVIYGREWEDIMYFGDLYKAKYKLAVQTKHAIDFTPFIREYTLKDGVYVHTNREWYITGDLSEFVYHDPIMLTEKYINSILNDAILEYQLQ